MRFPFDESQPATHVGPLPDRADVVVIGGGVIGVCTALYLAREGVSVVLLEKGRIAGEQSSRNWGWIRQQGRDSDELPIMVEANRLWRDLAAETNVDFGLRQTGVAYLAQNAREMERFSRWLPNADQHGVETRLLSAAEIKQLFPGLHGPCAGGLYTPSDMRAEPWLAVPALAGIAVRHGAQLREGCAVRALDVEAGRVTGVVTEAGRIAASEVVLAGGAWSALFLGRHGVSIPQLSVRASVAATAPLPEVFPGGAAFHGVGFRHRADGGYSLASSGFHELFVGPHAFRSLRAFRTQLMADPFGTRLLPFAPEGYPDAWGTARHWSEDGPSPFERMRILNPKPNSKKLQSVAKTFAKFFPQLPEVKLRTQWAGMIDTFPDLVPVIDRVSDLPGLTLGTGMSGHGFGIGPAVGRCLAAIVQRKQSGHDLRRFRFERFRDGSPMRLGPAL